MVIRIGNKLDGQLHVGGINLSRFEVAVLNGPVTEQLLAAERAGHLSIEDETKVVTVDESEETDNETDNDDSDNDGDDSKTEDSKPDNETKSHTLTFAGDELTLERIAELQSKGVVVPEEVVAAATAKHAPGPNVILGDAIETPEPPVEAETDKTKTFSSFKDLTNFFKK